MKIKTSEHVSSPWRPDDLPESIEDRFIAATLGYDLDEREALQDLATWSAYIRTAQQLEKWSKACRGSKAGKVLKPMLRHLDREARCKLDNEGVDPRDLIRSGLVLLFGAPPAEIEELVSACVEYGEARAMSFVGNLFRQLNRTAGGRAFLSVIGVDAASTREAAKRDGKSHVSVVNMRRRIRERLSTVEVTV